MTPFLTYMFDEKKEYIIDSRDCESMAETVRLAEIGEDYIPPIPGGFRETVFLLMMAGY
jgi:hypothetical protein